MGYFHNEMINYSAKIAKNLLNTRIFKKWVKVGSRIRVFEVFFFLVTIVGNPDNGFVLSLYYAIGNPDTIVLLERTFMGSDRLPELSGCWDITFWYICIL